MILDDIIIALVGLIELILMLFAGTINLFIVLIELIVGIFIEGFKIKKIPRKKFNNSKNSDESDRSETQSNFKHTGWLILITIAFTVIIFSFIICI